MPAEAEVSRHYAHGNLMGAIRTGLAASGKSIETATLDDLAPVDEFHIGGRQATEDFLSQLGFTPEKHVLELGSGLGGSARFVASRYGSRVAGIDITPEYVETAIELCRSFGLEKLISLHHGSALATPFPDTSFDGAYMMHVGMNIEDKERLAAEVARVLRPGGVFGIYDIMRIAPGDLAYPVPWATAPDLSALAEPRRYREALEAAGFRVTAERNRRDFALSFFEDLRARNAAAGGPPPLGLHLLMGRNTPDKVANMIANISKGFIAPVEMIAHKR
jgi:ubiquinone/menaquinone biosynthesis C-methylase UbiE